MLSNLGVRENASKGRSDKMLAMSVCTKMLTNSGQKKNAEQQITGFFFFNPKNFGECLAHNKQNLKSFTNYFHFLRSFFGAFKMISSLCFNQRNCCSR